MRLILLLLTFVNLVEPSPSELVDSNCPWVLARTDKRTFQPAETYTQSDLSDYDLSLVCTSKCDDKYLRCSSTCSSSYCLLECHRIAVACDDCKSPWVQFYRFFFTGYFIYLACPCHTDCIDGCQGCENPICFCNVSQQVKITNKW